MNETQLVQKILKAVRQKYGADIKVIKTHGNGYMEAGTPDIIGVFKGTPFLWEVKRSEKEKPTKLQLKRLDEWGRAGAGLGVIHSVEEALEHLSWMEP